MSLITIGSCVILMSIGLDSFTTSRAIDTAANNAPVLSHYLLTEQEQDIARNQLPNEYRLDSKGIELFG